MGLFGLFGKSTLQKVIDKLKENNLGSQAHLLKNVRNPSLTDDKKRLECDMLKKTFNLKQPGANESLNRFKWAKDICAEHNYSEGMRFMQYYVEVYELYLKEYCD